MGGVPLAQQPDRSDARRGQEFAEQAQRGRSGVLREFWSFLRRERKWWLTPIVLLLLGASALVLLGGTSVAPLIYAVF